MWNQFFPPCLLFHISLTSFSSGSIQCGYGQLGLFDGFCPIRCCGDQMSALSGSSSHCPMMNSRQWALFFVAALIFLLLTCADGCFTGALWNQGYYTQINFQWLNRAENSIIFILIVCWLQRPIRCLRLITINQEHLRVKALCCKARNNFPHVAIHPDQIECPALSEDLHECLFSPCGLQL